jgi:hypothetical protein
VVSPESTTASLHPLQTSPKLQKARTASATFCAHSSGLPPSRKRAIAIWKSAPFLADTGEQAGQLQAGKRMVARPQEDALGVSTPTKTSATVLPMMGATWAAMAILAG